MTKKDYELIARAIAHSVLSANLSPKQENEVTQHFIVALRQQNPLFQANKFSQFIEQVLRTEAEEWKADQLR